MSAVLGFDTATAWLTVAVSSGGEIVRETVKGPGAEGRPRHSELLLREIEACVTEAGGWERIELIAVGLGPGSYTGLRIGIATARALAQARELPVAGVGTLAALAAGIGERADAAARPALPVLDAKRSQAFAALYEAGSGAESWTPLVVSPGELAERVRGLDPAPLAAGDGSLRFRDQLEAAGAAVAAPDDEAHRVSARHICALGEGSQGTAPTGVEPIYLRAPDAERWLERDRTNSDE
jgi:tRNA threonylcarbamoyladenosine biosynthesis protein TsaB